MDATELLAASCVCGADLNKQRYAICDQCVKHMQKKKNQEREKNVQTAKDLIQVINKSKKTNIQEDQFEEQINLSKQELELREELKRLTQEYTSISQQNGNLLASIFKNQVEILTKFNEREQQINRNAAEGQKQVYLNMKMNEQKQRLRNIDLLEHFLKLELKAKEKKWLLNGIELNSKNLHLILPLMQYIFEIQTNRGKAPSKYITYIDSEEKIIVLQEEIMTDKGVKKKEKQIAIQDVKTEFWISYLEKQIYEFALFHKIQIESFSYKKMVAHNQEAIIFQFLSLIKFMLRAIDDY